MASAQEQCRKWGGNLTSITSKQEANFIYNMLGITKETYWVGLRYHRSVGRIKWLDGLPNSYGDWVNGKPNFSVAGMDCTAIWPHRKWDTLSCVQKLPFICKREFPDDRRIPNTEVVEELGGLFPEEPDDFEIK